MHVRLAVYRRVLAGKLMSKQNFDILYMAERQWHLLLIYKIPNFRRAKPKNTYTYVYTYICQRRTLKLTYIVHRLRTYKRIHAYIHILKFKQ